MGGGEITPSSSRARTTPRWVWGLVLGIPLTAVVFFFYDGDSTSASVENAVEASYLIAGIVVALLAWRRGGVSGLKALGFGALVPVLAMWYVFVALVIFAAYVVIRTGSLG